MEFTDFVFHKAVKFVITVITLWHLDVQTTLNLVSSTAECHVIIFPIANHVSFPILFQ